jgi:hypothetical protein
MRRNGQKAAGWGSTVLMSLVLIMVGFLAPVAIHVAAPQWEAPVIFGGLTTSVALFAAAARLPVRAAVMQTLIVGAVALLLMCGILAGVHGWGLAVALLGPLASLGLVMYATWDVGRHMRRVLAQEDEEAATVREPYMPPPMVLPGQATESHPSRAKVARTATLEMVVLTVACSVEWFFTRNGQLTERGVTKTVLCAMLAVLLLWGLGMSVVLLVRRRPAVVLMAEGFIDNATLGASGTGYIRWREVIALVPIGKRAQRRLLILVIDPEAVLRRLSRWQGMQLMLVGMRWPTPVAIAERLLPMRVEDLQKQMERRVEAAGVSVQ